LSVLNSRSYDIEDWTVLHSYARKAASMISSALNDNEADVNAIVSGLFNELEFSSFAGQTIKDLDVKGLVKTAVRNIKLQTANFDYINGDDQVDFNEQFDAALGTVLGKIGDENLTPDLCVDGRRELEAFIAETEVGVWGFCEQTWPTDSCSNFNKYIEDFNGMKLRYGLFESDTLAMIAAEVRNRVSKNKAELEEKQQRLAMSRELATQLIAKFDEKRTALNLNSKLRDLDADDASDAKLTSDTFINDVQRLMGEMQGTNAADNDAGRPLTFNFDSSALQMLKALEQEAISFQQILDNNRRKRKRRSFSDLDYDDLEDRKILRQHVPFFNEPYCGEGAHFTDYSHHGPWKMDNSPFHGIDHNDADYEKNMRVWHTFSVPVMRYFSGKRFAGCSCDTPGQIYVDGVCKEKLNGCSFDYDGNHIFLEFGQRYHYDCHNEFYCKADGSFLHREQYCPDKFCRLDVKSGDAVCEWLGWEPCLSKGVDIVAVPLFDQSSYSGPFDFSDILAKYGGASDNIKFTMLYAHNGMVKSGSSNQIETWSSSYSTMDIISLLTTAEGHFANSMAANKIAFIHIDAFIMAKFDTHVLNVIKRMRAAGIKFYVQEIQDIPMLFKSALSVDSSFRADMAENYVPEFCSPNECDYNNGGCSHQCRWNQYMRAVCLCPTGYVLDNDRKTCLPTNVTCEVTMDMEASYKQWKQAMDTWDNS